MREHHPGNILVLCFFALPEKEDSDGSGQDSPEAQQSLLDLFQACDGGSTYGSPTDQMRKYLRDAMQAELVYFNDVLLDKPIDEDRAMLFGGTSARSAIRVASAALISKTTGERVTISVQ